MIYEVRTYDLKPGTVGAVEKAFEVALPVRQKYSPLAAFWHTDIGPLNQIIHVWGYESLEERDRIRSEASKEEATDKPEEAPPILPQEEAVPSMPLKVALAIKLIYIQVVISIVYSLFLPLWGGDSYRAGAPELELDAAGLHIFMLCASVIGGLVACFFAYNIGKGRNWARIILAILTIGGIFLVGINGQGIEVLLEIGNTILSLVIVVFLFISSLKSHRNY